MIHAYTRKAILPLVRQLHIQFVPKVIALQVLLRALQIARLEICTACARAHTLVQLVRLNWLNPTQTLGVGVKLPDMVPGFCLSLAGITNY